MKEQLERKKKRRILLRVAYDGTHYHGWQLQTGAVTIEGELNRALTELLGVSVSVTGGSRTDSGVHALCNPAVFDTEARMPAEKYKYALNQRLPEDIRVQSSEEVPADFHPRRTESRKTYEYHIYQADVPLPTRRLYSFFTYLKLDVQKMAQAGKLLIGEHDFKSFCSSAAQAQTTVRTIYALDVSKENGEIVIRVCGNGFLYNMIRIIAGTLMEVGEGKRTVQDITAILKARERSAAGPTAPACGLILTRYEFARLNCYKMCDSELCDTVV